MTVLGDPVIEATQRAWPKGNHGRKLVANRPRLYMEAAARQAMNPVREWYGQVLTMYEGQDDHESRTILALLDELAPLIYATKEMA